jgi:hypothetical protein
MYYSIVNIATSQVLLLNDYNYSNSVDNAQNKDSLNFRRHLSVIIIFTTTYVYQSKIRINYTLNNY